MKKQTRLFTALLAFAVMATPPAILAQDDLLADAQSVLNQEQIDISGDFDAPEEKSPEEMVEEARQTNEKKNVQRISKKVANLKVSKKEVKKITKKESENLSGRISNIFGIGSDKDSVSTGQAATTKKVVVAKVEVSKPKDLGQENVRIIPTAGFQSIQGEGINFESKYSTGLAIETMVSSNFSVGFGVNYSSLDIKDIKSNQFGFNNNYGISYDELEYSHLNLNAQGKYFFSRGMFRPYIGLGLGFNRTSLKYSANSSNTNNNNFGFNNSSYYTNNNLGLTEEYSESYVSGSMAVGAEMKFAKNVGVVVEGSYSQGLTDGFNSQSVYGSDRQVRLDEIGGAISSSSFFALNAGLLVTF